MSNLVEHARYELELLGEEPETIEGYLKVVQAFADMGHSGASAEVAIPTLERLLRFMNLTPLTDDPAEWEHHGEVMFPPVGVWQSRRCSEAFSTDGGKTYHLVGSATDTIYNSVPSKDRLVDE